jgi:hypothetical protein
MTTATTKTRQRKGRAAATALIPRGQHLIDQGADMLILSARLAETPPPVFWANGELEARTTLAVTADTDWDERYERVLPGDENPWEWYRASLLAEELERIPVAVVEVAHADPRPSQPLPVFLPAPASAEDANLDARVAALWATWEEFSDPPVGAPGPGSPDQDEADA